MNILEKIKIPCPVVIRNIYLPAFNFFTPAPKLYIYIIFNEGSVKCTKAVNSIKCRNALARKVVEPANGKIIRFFTRK
jgi:hypothetical protein